MLNTRTIKRNTIDPNTDYNMATTSDTVSYTSNYKIRCEKCDGTGYQQDNDGIWHTCPICEGTGYRECKCAPCVPYYPPYNPWCPGSWGDDITYEQPRREYIVTC
jgi:RecJ-like exonuclease